ncbi:MAG: thioesterase family protein [Deltaproteobacteria bacterium]|nr:thioesterase family protein [Deltaproteobacteria bacterium]
MKESLKPGIEHELSFKITDQKTVPALYPESEEFQAMPNVFATGYMVGFIEWACIQAVNPHLDWPHEQTVGIHINVSHISATPPGLTVTAKVILRKIDGRKLLFDVKAHDGVDQICRGSHERFVICQEKFNKKVSEKAEPVRIDSR